MPLNCYPITNQGLPLDEFGNGKAIHRDLAFALRKGREKTKWAIPNKVVTEIQ